MTVTEAKGKLYDLVRSVNDGQKVVLTHRDEPVARIVPYYGQSYVDRSYKDD
jgi:prevent-host-death family protein